MEPIKERSRWSARAGGHFLTWFASSITAVGIAIAVQIYGPELRERAFPSKPWLEFSAIRENSDGNLLVFVQNHGSRHSVVKKIHFCPPGEWYAADLTDQDRPSLFSWESSHKQELFTIFWEQGEWRTFCRVRAETLRVLEGNRGVAPDSSIELVMDAPKRWFLKTAIDRHTYRAHAKCALTLYATAFFISQAVPCDPKEPSDADDAT